MGCCGAYCGTCPVIKEQLCKGCKIGYLDGQRDIGKAKCKTKKCCIKKGYNSCADCSELDNCQIINDFYSKNGFKYAKYKEAINFIKRNGYDNFFTVVNNWKNAYGKYK
ncbi:MAG: DUF3795 domain-containing protein [Clostridiaceae bacterium]|nr:DUF3795 domain-containing protein [Clostridiaceae bacterium]